MACQQDFYKAEDLEAVLEAIDEEIWDKNVDFNAEGDGSTRKLKEELPKSGFQCEKCEKLVLITLMRPLLHSVYVRIPLMMLFCVLF